MTFESGLYVVATPIGNLADISQRAIDLLKAAEIVAVEDSRVTGKLLHHLGIKKKMRRYNDHSGEVERESLVATARGAVARELTKKFEEVVTGTAAELAARYAEHEPKGEIVLIVGPPADNVVAETGDLDAALKEALATMSAAKAAGAIAKRFGLERNAVYARASELKAS